MPPLPELRGQVATLHQDYQAARYETVVRQLPDLITLIDGVPRIAADERGEMLCTYVFAYVGVAKLLTKFGVTDLAVLAADRAATIAVEADSLGARGMAAYQVVCAQLRADHTDEAERLAVRMAEKIHESATTETPKLASVAGALWLIAAVAAARNAAPRRRCGTTRWSVTCCARCSPAHAARTASCTTSRYARACWTRPSVPAHLALVACGAPLAARAHDVAAQAVEAGWIVRVVATPSAMNWVDADRVEKVTGFTVLVEQRQPGQAKRFPPPAQVIVCPATFNTVNKLAVGIMDNYAAGLLCEALASQTPITIAPMVNNRLWSHPVWQRNLDVLTAAGVSHPRFCTALRLCVMPPGWRRRLERSRRLRLRPVECGRGDA